MSDIDILRHLTAALYEAVLDTNRLPVFLKELAVVVGADASVLAVTSQGTESHRPTSAHHGLSAEGPRALSRVLDPASPGPPEDAESWREALGDPSITDSLTLPAEPLDGQEGFLALLRRDGVFDEPTRGSLERFRPHLPHALRLLREVDVISRRCAAAEHLGDVTGHSLAVVDGDSRLIASNRAFRTLVGVGDGLWVEQGRIRLADLSGGDSLSALIGRARARRRSGHALPVGAFSVSRARSARPLGIVVTPLLGRDGAHDRATVDGDGELLFGLHVSALERTPVPPVEVLRGLFGLTPAEASLLQALVADQRIEDVAEARGVSITTVRTQLAHLFRKTNTSRQSELVRLALLAACSVAYPEASDGA